MTELVGRSLANYSILDAIGQGGMATVYRARDVRDGTIVAIKVLSPYVAADPKFRGRFDREVNLLRRLQHPNIVPILAFGQANGYHYIVMPYFAGGTLYDRLRAGPLLPLEGARIVEQISSALTFAHQQGIIHRDVKPSNVLLGENGEAKLTDFGFAFVPWESVSLTGSMLIGTPAYMSPEQCRGEKVGPESDQYSFGVVLYQMCTGRLPYEADTPMGVVIKQASQSLPPPRLANPNLPVAVEEVLVKVLSKNPAERYESIEALNGAFQAAIKASIDPSGTYRLRQLRAELPTENLPRRQVARAWAKDNLRKVRRFAPLLALLFVFGCPAAAWGLGILPPIWDGWTTVSAQGDVDFPATINALSTANAPLEGTVVTPGAVETAVYGTVVAMGFPVASLEAITQEAALLAVDGATLTSTPSPTLTPWGYWATPTRTPTRQNTPKPGEPTWTPTATPTRTPTATPPPSGPTDTPVTPPTSTTEPPPTDTSVPPTDTPKPPTDTPVPPPPTDTPEPTSTFTKHPTKTPSCKGNQCTPTPG